MQASNSLVHKNSLDERNIQLRNLEPMHVEALSRPYVSELLQTGIIDAEQFQKLNDHQVSALYNFKICDLLNSKVISLEQFTELNGQQLAILPGGNFCELIKDGTINFEQFKELCLKIQHRNLLQTSYICDLIRSGRLNMTRYLSLTPAQCDLLKTSNDVATRLNERRGWESLAVFNSFLKNQKERQAATKYNPLDDDLIKRIGDTLGVRHIFQ